MPEVTAKSFLNLLTQSGLVTQEELKPALSELSRKAAGNTVRLDALVDHLVQSGLITTWHVDKIKAGKTRGFFLGKYKLLRHLGTGGMSTVYLARNTIFNQLRAIKVLPRKRVADKSYLERFYREGRAAASLNHKNIVRVYDIDNDGETHYLVMEYVDGKDLYEIVKDEGPMEVDRILDYTVQALTGLKHAHENNIVHRDVKPANFLVAPGGVIKVLDLGLALLREEDASLTVMHNEKILGTADYLSPEQAVDSHTVDHRADFYSLGCTVYYMLTGQPPFPEGTMAQRIARHQTQKPKSILELRPDCPQPLVDVCNQMMEKKPEDRFQNCDKLIPVFQRLRQDIASGSIQATPPPATQPRVAATSAKSKSGVRRAATAAPAKSPSSKKARVADAPATQAKAAAGRPGKAPQGGAPPKGATPARNAPSANARAAVQIQTPESPSSKIKSDVGVNEFREFARRNPVQKKTRKLRTVSPRNQVIVGGLVVVMLLILGLVMFIAMRLTAPGETEKNESRWQKSSEKTAEIVRFQPETRTNPA